LVGIVELETGLSAFDFFGYCRLKVGKIPLRFVFSRANLGMLVLSNSIGFALNAARPDFSSNLRRTTETINGCKACPESRGSALNPFCGFLYQVAFDGDTKSRSKRMDCHEGSPNPEGVP